MRRLFSIIAVIFLMVVFVFGQQQKEEKFAGMGSSAVLFSFSGLDNLNADTFNGGIGGKYYLSDNAAIVVGMQLNSISKTTPANPDTDQVGLDGEYSKFDFGLSAGFEWHFKLTRVSPYVGAGMTFSLSSSENFAPMKWYKNSTGNIIKVTEKISGVYSFGIFGIGGVEYFITKNFSLSAEYHLCYDYNSGGTRTVTYSLIQGIDPRYPIEDETENASTNFFGFTTGGALTIAIYF